jgi:hypothetical protein
VAGGEAGVDSEEAGEREVESIRTGMIVSVGKRRTATHRRQ